MEDSDCFSLIDENDSLISPDADVDADDASLTYLRSGSILYSRFTFFDIFLKLFLYLRADTQGVSVFRLVYLCSIYQ